MKDETGTIGQEETGTVRQEETGSVGQEETGQFRPKETGTVRQEEKKQSGRRKQEHSGRWKQEVSTCNSEVKAASVEGQQRKLRQRFVWLDGGEKGFSCQRDRLAGGITTCMREECVERTEEYKLVCSHPFILDE